MSRRPFRIAAALGATAVVMSYTAVATSAEIPSSVDVWGSNAYAAGIHQSTGSSNFPNFSSGLVDNRYPFANAGLDASPGSHAVSSVVDYGPFAEFLFASDPPQPLPVTIPYPPHNPPPALYATSQFPSNDGKSHHEFSNGAGDTSIADATETSASSSATYAGAAGVVTNALASAKTTLNPDGSLSVSTHSHVGDANFGGVLEIRNVDVTTSLKSVAGAAKVLSTVSIGSVLVGGTPTTIGSDGITVAGQSAPVNPGTSTGTASPALSFHVYLAAPQSSTTGSSGAIYATGVHVDVLMPGAAGVPSVWQRYVLGEGRAEGFANPAQAAAGTDASTAAPVLSDGGGGTTVITNNINTPTPTLGVSGGIVQAPGISRSGPVTLLASQRPPVVPMFFLWEALVMGTAASLVWARRRTVEE